MRLLESKRKCIDCGLPTTKTWCKPCGYKNRRKNTWSTGHPMSEETKQKISLRKKGIKNPQHSKWMKENSSYLIGHKKPNNANEKNVNWLGNNVSYRGLHLWVVSKLGKPAVCELCARDNLAGRKIHWANISHEYKRDLSDWIRLCAKCHKAYDMGRIEL